MQLYKILREIQRRKFLVAAVLIVAVAVGALLVFKPGLPPQSRQYQVAVASSDILVDTTNSQVVDVGGRGPDLPTLAARANLLGNLMTVGPLKEAIAKSAGVAPNDLVVVPPANAETPGVAPTPVKTGQGTVPKNERTTLTLSTDDTLPILHVVAEAPDAATAEKLASSTIVQLRKYLGSVAASQEIPAARQLVVRQFGSPAVGTVTRGLPRSVAVALTLVLALLGVALVVGGSWFVRSWKRFEEEEEEAERGGHEGAERNGHENGSLPPEAQPSAPLAGAPPKAGSAILKFPRI